MRYLEECEFFGFVPTVFLSEFKDSLNDLIAGLATELSKLRPSKTEKISSILTEAFDKNYFIFSNFILRNIFKFPPTFKLERKRTDLVISADIQRLLDDVINSLDEEEYYKYEIEQIKAEIMEEEYKQEKYKDLLRDNDSVERLLERLGALDSGLKAAEKLVYDICGYNDGQLNALLEHRELKSGLYKEERDSLYRIASLDSLINVNEALEKC